MKLLNRHTRGTPSLKRWGFRFLGVFILGLAGLNVLAFLHARSMTHFRRDVTRTLPPEELSWVQKGTVLLTGVSLPRPESALEPESLHPDCEERFISGDNVTLAAWWVGLGGERPLVVWFHGYGSQKTSLLKQASAMIEEGVSVMLVDFRGSGGSSESYTTMGVKEAEDVRLVVAYVREHLPHSHLILAGTSMGGAAILRAISEEGVEVEGVLIQAVFDSLVVTTRNRFRAMGVPSFPSAELLVFWGGIQWGYNGFRHNPARFAEKVNCPALFLHGKRDPRATWEEVNRVFAQVPGPKTLVGFADSGHESLLARDPEKWRKSVRVFLEQVQTPADPEVVVEK